MDVGLLVLYVPPRMSAEQIEKVAARLDDVADEIGVQSIVLPDNTRLEVMHDMTRLLESVDGLTVAVNALVEREAKA